MLAKWLLTERARLYQGKHSNSGVTPAELHGSGCLSAFRMDVLLPWWLRDGVWLLQDKRYSILLEARKVMPIPSCVLLLLLAGGNQSSTHKQDPSKFFPHLSSLLHTSPAWRRNT